MDEKHERALRRKAIRLTLKGLRPPAILAQIPRSRRWLLKWQTRYTQWGSAGLVSHSRRPKQRRTAYPARVRRMVVRIRRQLEKRHEGWIGAEAILDEIQAQRLLRKLPAVATVNRWLQAADCFPKRRRTEVVYFPQPTGTVHYRLQLMDWTARYLQGGAKVFAFHSLDLHTSVVKQTICTDKRFTAARAHVLEAWQCLGLPDGLQIDNDAAFNGGNKVPHVISQFVRLCLYVGIEPIFIPEQEAKRNGAIEGVNSIWGRGWWRRRRFRNVAQVQRTTPAFEAWYSRQYRLDPAQDSWPAPRILTMAQAQSLPAGLPITAGRIHFIRLVRADGTIRLLNETWPVHKRLAGRYVWATIVTQEQSLSIYYRPSADQPVRLVKRLPYPLPEPIRPIRPEFKRPYRRRMRTML